MKKPWLIMGLHPLLGPLPIGEADTLESANLMVSTGILQAYKHRFEGSQIEWVLSRRQYEENYQKDLNLD